MKKLIVISIATLVASAITFDLSGLLVYKILFG